MSDAAQDAEILGEAEAGQAPAVRVEEVRARLTFFDQRGRGHQSKAGPPEGPGSERLWVLQPMASLGLRQRDERFGHSIVVAVDIVSSASADGLDAISSASRENEAGTLDVTSSFAPNDRDTWSVRYGVHIEEPWRTVMGGFAYAGRFAQDNTGLTVSTNFIFDAFDRLHPRGWNNEQARRYTLNNNVALSQVLSRTTLAVASYGMTFQTGTLATTWNSVYIADAPIYGCFDDPSQSSQYDCANRLQERFPKSRLRHALALELAQHVPKTRSTLKVKYRYYRDDVSLAAHTASIKFYQYIVPRFYLRGMYRFHTQSGVDFYTTSVTSDYPPGLPVTADSDLAPFRSHMGGIKALFFITPQSSARGIPQYVDASYARYQRSNNLHLNVFTIGYGRSF